MLWQVNGDKDMNSIKPSTFYQLKGYAGLETMAEQLSEYFPKNINNYVEPFAGLGRTAKFVKSNNIHLNDLSDYSVDYLRKEFPQALVTQLDYHTIFEQYEDVEPLNDMFMLIDPPWRKNIYKNNAKPVFTGNSVISYYDDILKYLEDANYKWILCVDKDEHEIGKRVSKSGWTNIVLEHPMQPIWSDEL